MVDLTKLPKIDKNAPIASFKMIVTPLFPTDGRKIYTFNQADPVRAGLFPPKALREHVKKFGDHPDDWAYGFPLGPEDIRQGIIDGINERHSMSPKLTFEEAFVSTGAVAGELLPILQSCSIVDNGTVMTYDPFYPSYYGVPKYFGMGLVTYSLQPEDDWAMTREVLEENYTSDCKYIILNQPNNPTGRAFTNEEIKTFFDFAREKDLMVISDEVYWSCCYQFDIESYVKNGYAKGVEILLVHSFSKCFAIPGPRAGFMVKLQSNGKKGRIDRVWDRIRDYLMLHISPSTFSCYIMRFILNNYPFNFFEHGTRCEIASDTMYKRLSESEYVIKAGKTEGGIITLHHFKLPPGWNNLALAMEFVKVGVGTLPADLVSTNPKMEDGWFRMTNMLSEEDCNDAADRILGVLEKAHKGEL